MELGFGPKHTKLMNIKINIYLKKYITKKDYNKNIIKYKYIEKYLK